MKAIYLKTLYFMVTMSSGIEKKFESNEFTRAYNYAVSQAGILIEHTNKGNLTLYNPN